MLNISKKYTQKEVLELQEKIDILEHDNNIIAFNKNKEIDIIRLEYEKKLVESRFESQAGKEILGLQIENIEKQKELEISNKVKSIELELKEQFEKEVGDVREDNVELNKKNAVLEEKVSNLMVERMKLEEQNKLMLDKLLDGKNVSDSTLKEIVKSISSQNLTINQECK